VTARLERVDPSHEGQVETIKARYVVGCDGARSAVRKSIGRALHGDSANHAWGVMDVLAVTDFPDVRFKSLIQSANDGSIIIIPREGGYSFASISNWTSSMPAKGFPIATITADDLIAAARRILKPHTLDVKEVAWWSVYEIGQRLCDKFDDVPQEDVAKRLPRVFIAGDACHTHSPKAGQGMNVSMQDGFNLGWKLASVLRKRCAPHLLHTYSAERQAIAKDLIDFDREWAAMLASSKGFDAAETQRYFVRHGRYTAGTAAHYRPSILTGEATLAASGRGADDRHAFSFRAGHPHRGREACSPRPRGQGGRPLAHIRVCRRAGSGCVQLRHPRSVRLSQPGTRNSPVTKYTPADEDIDAVFDVRAVFQQSHHDLAVEAMPSLLLPRKGRYGLCDYERCSAPTSKAAMTSSPCVASIANGVHGGRAAGPIRRARSSARWLSSSSRHSSMVS
jgi:phenol 2-monooxygenase